MLHDGHVVIVTMKEKMSNYCLTNLGSLMILWTMKKDSTIFGLKRLWQSTSLMQMSHLYIEFAFLPSIVTFSAYCKTPPPFQDFLQI
jgi:hypothetical protein